MVDPNTLLGDDLLRACLHCVPNRRCRTAVMAVCTRWRTMMREVVRDELQRRQITPSPFNPLLQLTTLEWIEDHFGPKPEAHWKDTFGNTMTEAMRLQCNMQRSGWPPGLVWNSEVEEDFREAFATPEFMEEKLELEAREVASSVKAGLSLEQAQAFHVICCNAPEVLFLYSRPLMRPEDAVCNYAVYDTLRSMAGLQGASIAPAAYCGFTGEYGLHEDAEWVFGLNMDGEPEVGRSWVAHRMATFITACEESFPDDLDDGIYHYSGATALSSTVVCIQSAPSNSGGRRSLIKEVGSVNTRASGACYLLPPGAIVTLVSVQDTWRVRRKKMRCRLYTCEIVFDM